MPINRFKKRYIRFITILIPFFIGMNLLSFNVSAQDTSDIDPYVDGRLSPARCIAKGNIDFITFLNGIIYSDGFFEGVIEPWRDVLARNKCHAIDVGNLIKQRDKVRTQIRDSFLTCNNQKIPALREAFYKYNAEIYYVRHVVDGGAVLSLPYDLLTTRMLGDPNAFYYPRDKLYKEMKEKYADSGIMEKTTFDQFFLKLEFKYRDRKKSYIICESGSWEEVVKKWEEFISTAGGITPAWNNLEKGVGGRAEKISEAATDMSLEAYLKGIVQVNLNNLAIEPGLAEISENISDYLPNIDVPTQSSFLQAIEIAEKRFDTEAMREDLVSRFETLYKDTSDSSVDLLVTALDNWNIVLLNSFEPMDAVLECTQMMNDRQCP